jgi:hypothetical protein
VAEHPFVAVLAVGPPRLTVEVLDDAGLVFRDFDMSGLPAAPDGDAALYRVAAASSALNQRAESGISADSSARPK